MTDLKCFVCEKTDALYRCNPKGEPGVWACPDHYLDELEKNPAAPKRHALKAALDWLGGLGTPHAEVISLANAFVRYADSGQHGVSTVSE